MTRARTGTPSEIVEKLRELERFKKYTQSRVMIDLKVKTLDRLWAIYGTTAMKPEAAAFNIGRIFEAFQEYADVLVGVELYQKMEEKLAQTQKTPSGTEATGGSER